MSVDLDAFAFKDDPDPQEEPTSEVIDPVPVQLGFDGDAATPPPPGADHLMALVFRSRSDGPGHVVTVFLTNEGKGVLCNCEAGRNIGHRPKGCWAMVFARSLIGIRGVV